MNLFKRLFKPKVVVEEEGFPPLFKHGPIQPCPYPPQKYGGLLAFSEDYERQYMIEPLPDSTKPCRFLKEKVAESSEAGIPCGIYRVCAHPFFSEGVVDVALQSLNKVRKALIGVEALMSGRAESPIVLSPQATAEMLSDLLAEALNWTDHTGRVLTSARERHPSMEDEKHKKWLTKTAEEERAERQDTTFEFVNEKLGERYP